jgi:uncharacterized protein YkwD
MFPRLRGGPGAGRGVVLALLAVAIGAGVLLAGDDGMSTGTTRLAVTGTTPAPARVEIEPSAASDSPATVAAPVTPTSAPAGEPSTAVPATTAPAAAAVEAVVAAGAVAAPPASTTTTSTTAPASTTTVTTTPPPTTTTAPPAGPARLSSAEAAVVPLTNADRRAAGLGSLTRDACLDGVASRYAEQLAGSGVLAHNPGAGAAVIGCRPGATWGDNVGTSEPCDTALLEEKWMASPGHRQNILTGAFQLVGIGAWSDTAGGCWIQVLFSS